MYNVCSNCCTVGHKAISCKNPIISIGIIAYYKELVDEKTNCNQFMAKLVDIYHLNCKQRLSKTKIREILKRDIFWDTATSIQNGFVDEIWNSNTSQQHH